MATKPQTQPVTIKSAAPEEEAAAILAAAAEAETIATATAAKTQAESTDIANGIAQSIQESTQAPASDLNVPVVGTPVTEPVRPVVQSVVTVTPKQVVADIVASKVEKPTATVEGFFNEYTGAISKLSVSTQMRFTRLAAYLNAMKPGKPMGNDEGASYQRLLLDVLTGIINSEEDFSTAFGILVQVFKQNRKGCFADTHAGRFMHNLPGSTEERLAFQRILSMMLVLGSLEDVTLVRRQVNLQHATAFVISAEGRERLIAWFN